nr:transcription factor TFIIIB component B'' homolog [Anolis sagrei ordinatus]
MFRRARFSVKPNVRPSTAAAGRGSRGPVPALTVGPEPGGEQGPEAAAGDASGGAQQGGNKGGSRDEKTNQDGDCSKRAEALLQRRKRFSTVPNLAKPRITSTSTQGSVNPASKHSTKQLPHSSTLGSSVLHKETSSERVNVEISPKSPALPEKKTPVPQVPQFSPLKKSSSKEPNTCPSVQRSDEALQKSALSPLKERPTQEKLIQDETVHSKSGPEKDKNRCSEREKIIKSQTLRKMLKEELKKEKEQRKYKSTLIEKNVPEDRSKMIMRDFIYYLPENNPMKSSLMQERRSEKTSTATQAKEPEEKIVAEHEDEDEEDEETGAGEEDGPLLVPRVKVAEDGSIILDEESLTVEVLRTKGQCVVEENDPIFERGSTTTYSSFRKSYYTKPWSEKETDMFFLAISMVGTDFSLISQLFPHRARTEIKNKFKREEKANGWRIDKAFKEKKPFDFNWFAKLLEKVLENERKQKEKYAKNQQQNEKKSSEKKAQKRLKVKVVNGQSSHGQDDFQISETEMEVDAETAEKENEVSPSILEQAEGQTMTESVVTKKKRKRKKKDSEHETDNPLEERTTPEEMVEGERLRKKRKNTASIEVNSINEDDEELEVTDRVTPDETLSLVEEDPQCCIVDEAAEQNCISSIHDSTFIEVECSELDVLENSSEHQNGWPSVTPDTNKNGFEEINAAQNDTLESDILDGNQNAASQSLDEELRKTEIAAIKKPTVEGQRTPSDFTGTSEKGGLSISNTSEMKSRGSSVKNAVEDNVNDIIDPISEETNNNMENKSQNCSEIQGGHAEKTEVRGRRQKPKPNILKASGRKEAPAQSNLEKPEMFGAVEKNNDQDDMPTTSIVVTTEKDPRHLDTESLASKKSTVQENSKQTVLKPAPLARGRMQRPKPNLGCVVRRQGGSAKNIASEDGKTPVVAGEAEKTLKQHDCSGALLNKNKTEAVAYEAGMPQSEVLQNKIVTSAETEDCMPTSPGKRPLEFESHEFKNTSLSSKSLEIMVDAAVRDSSLQQDQKEIFAETESSVKSHCHNPKQSLGKATEKEEASQAGKGLLRTTHDSETTEESLEATLSEIVPLSDLLEESSADAPEAVALKPLQLSPPNLSGSKGGEPSKESRSSDIQKSVSLGSSSKQNLQGESKDSVVQPTLPLRSRFQKPKPNIGRAVARKETQPFVTNEATVTHTEIEKSEQQKCDPTRMSTVVAKPPQFSTTEALEKRSLGTAKMNQEDPHQSSTSKNILDPFLRKKPIQEGKPCAIKPAQLVRGLSQKAKPSPGRIKEKKEGHVSENIGAPIEGEDEVNLQASLEKLKKREKSETSEASLVESINDQEKFSSSENSQRCEVLKDKEACMTKDDVEERLLDITVRDISAPPEGSQSKTIKHTQFMRGRLHRPKPNIKVSTKRKGVNLEDINEEDQTERDTDTEATPFGSKSGEMATSIHVSGNFVKAATTSESTRQKDSTDSTETMYMKRSKHNGKCDSLEGTSGIGSQIKEGILKPSSVCEKAIEILKGKQPRRTVKQRKDTCDSRVPSECGNDRGEKGKPHQKSKQNASRGRTLKPFIHKKTRKESGSSKPSLVTLRASSQEDEGDEDDDDDSEVEWFSPDEVNKAPVFVPKGLRSPNPVPVQIEETMEEVEIYENVADEPCLIHELNTAAHPVMQGDNNLCLSQIVIIQEEQNKETGIADGSTEAAMTLLAMRDPAFQLNIATEEKPQEFPCYKELNVAERLPDEHNEEHIIIDCNVPWCVPSKNEPISSETVNRAAIEDPSTEPLDLEDKLQEQTNVLLPGSSKYEPVSSLSRRLPTVSGLEDCSQGTTRASSVSSTSKENKISRPARCRFPKPKPNLNRALGPNHNTSQKYLGLISDMEQFNQIRNEVSKNTTEEQTVELEEGAQISFAERHDLQPESLAVQRTNNKSENLVKETWKVTSELTASKLSPEAEISHDKPPYDSNTSISLQVSRSVEHHLSPAKVAEVGRSSYSGVSTITNMTAESDSIGEHTPAEEEPTFILTLVEIPNDSEHCSGIPPSLPQASEELLPAPVFFTPSGPDTQAPEREDTLGTITANAEENAVIIENSTEKPRLQTASTERLADLNSSSWKNWKRCAIALEGSDSRSGKKRSPSSSVQDIEMSNKASSHKLRSISKKPAEKTSEKWNLSKKTISSTSRLVPALHVGKKEQSQSPLTVWASLFDEAAGTDKQVSRTCQAGKAEKNEKQRNSVDSCKSLQSEQVGSTAIPPKTPLSRSYQRSLGFLPLICKNNNADEEEISKVKKEPFQKTQEVISERAAECPVSPKDQKEEIQENSTLPPTVPLSSKFEGRCSSTVQVLSELSDSKSSSPEQEKEEEPTRISEYFFNDIFMEVDDSE